MLPFENIFECLDKAIEVENQSRRADDFEESDLIGATEIRIMGQMSLLTNGTVTGLMRLFGTQDVDAVVTGGRYGWVAKKLSELLEAEGLELDEYADEIWLPRGAAFTKVFSGEYLTCLRLNHLDALVSKAVKAPAKNRILIRQALVVFPDLRALIKVNGGDLANFEEE